MSLDAYKERQDRAFDTFRSKYRLHEIEEIEPVKTHAARASISRPTNGRTISASTFGEATGQTQEADTLELPTTQLMFTPQIRKLEIAPWEDATEIVPVEAPKKVKKPRSSILKKLRRVTTASTKGPSSPDLSLRDADENASPASSLSSSTYSASSSKTTSRYAQTSASPRRSDIPLGRPLDDSEVQVIHQAIAFQPIDPNILHLKTPTVTFAASTTKGMKPSRSTPQIEYELETQTNRADRMSRMFDNLRFD